MTRLRIGGLLAALLLLLGGCASVQSSLAGPPLPPGAEPIQYRLSLDTQWGPIQVEGTTAYINDQFYIQTTTFGGWIHMQGKRIDTAMKVTGDYDGNYMAGQATPMDNRYVIGLAVTGRLISAVLTLSVPPSVAAKLPPPP
ncbi:MAG: hypothetical protein U1E53_06995 [Dongiaceae bacterium]